MAVDNSTLFRQIVDDLVVDLRNERDANLADKVCKRYERAALKGTLPLLGFDSTGARDKGGKAIGSAPDEVDLSLGSVNYDMLQYSKAHNIANQEIIDLDQYMDTLAEVTRILMDNVDTSIEEALEAAITSSTYNNSQAAANGAWDVNSSTPYTDINLGLTKVRNPDIIICGYATHKDLMVHPDSKEGVSYYAGDGAVPFDHVKMKLSQQTGVPVEKIFVLDSFKNSANQGQTATLASVADDLFWMGHSRGLCLVEQPGGSYTSTVDEYHTTKQVAVTRTLDIIRGNKNLGCYFTGIGT